MLSLRRVRPSLRKRMARMLWPEGQGIVRRGGDLYWLNLKSGNWYDKQLLEWGPGELEQRLFLNDQIRARSCDVFIDIGANLGTYAAHVARHQQCHKIIAYEADKRNHDKLRAHLLINGVADKVETRIVAVSDHEGTVPFMRYDDDGFNNSIVGDDGSGFAVPAVRLDDELPLTGHRIALKIDIEGHELAALQGMKRLLQANDCFLQVELWPENAAAFVAAMEAEEYRRVHRIEDDHYFAKHPE